ncbi:MAG TPA: hypothetical protein VJS64_09360 [Pyrinomonadaceae bacterium]|nr:hypothetical protein [Pyrinomonadaceae bacterium]
MKFIEVPHPEGGKFVFHIDHLTSATYRRGEGDVKTRLGIDLDHRQNDIVLFGEDAERAWRLIQQFIVATSD